MKRYYFLATMLPSLQIGLKPDISFQEFNFLIKNNLNSSDYEKTRVIALYYDLQNIRKGWLKQKGFESRGSQDEGELEESLALGQGLPGYVYDFLERYSTTEARVAHFSSLISLYFKKESLKATGFLKDYLMFEYEFRLTLAALRAKKNHRDVAIEMQHEDPDHPLVAQILSQKDSLKYEPLEAYEEVKPVFEAYQDNPLSLHMALMEYRFEKVAGMCRFKEFTIDKVLAFMIQLIIVEKWLEMDIIPNVKDSLWNTL